MDSGIGDILNQDTPFSPKDADDATRRLQNAPPPPAARSETSGDEMVPAMEESAGGDENLPRMLVHVPISRSEGADNNEFGYEVREISGAEPGLTVYTSEERLVEQLGAGQERIGIDIIELLRQVAGRVPVVVDPEINV